MPAHLKSVKFFVAVDSPVCKQHARKILDFFAREVDGENPCNAKCDFSPSCVVGCIEDKLKDAGAGAATDCICKVIPSKYCTGKTDDAAGKDGPDPGPDDYEGRPKGRLYMDILLHF